MKIIAGLLGQTAGVRAAGLDLNERGLCWVELRKDKIRGLVLERCLCEPLPPGCIVEGRILEFSEVEAALARLLAGPDAVPSAKDLPPLALAVPASVVTTHSVSFPASLSDAVLAQRLQADMAARVRLKADAICVDFWRRPAIKADGDSRRPKQCDLIAAAVAKEAVEDRVAMVEGAGLPWRVDLMASDDQAAVLAASRAVYAQAARPNAVMALVQLEAGGLQLDILREGKVLLSERFALARSPANEAQDECAPELPDGLLGALEASYGSAVAARPEQLWLVSLASQASAWTYELQERTGLPCALVNPFEGMDLGDPLDKRSSAEPAQALVACGLALMALGNLETSSQATPQPRFNFLPHREAMYGRRRKSFLMQLGAVALTVLLGGAVVRLAVSEQMQTQIGAQAEVKQHIARLDAELKRLAGEAAGLERLKDHERVLTSFAQARQQTPLMWQELSALLPDGLHLTSLRQDAHGAAVLSGQARSAAEVFGLVERLAHDSHYFKRPELLDLSFSDAAAATGQPTADLAASTAAPIKPITALAPAGSVERVVFTLRAESP